MQSRSSCPVRLIHPCKTVVLLPPGGQGAPQRNPCQACVSARDTSDAGRRSETPVSGFGEQLQSGHELGEFGRFQGLRAIG